MKQGRYALITGEDSGIGRADALAFAREEAEVAISYLFSLLNPKPVIRKVNRCVRHQDSTKAFAQAKIAREIC